MELYQIIIVFGFIGWLLAGDRGLGRRLKALDKRFDVHERRLDDHARKRKRGDADLQKNIDAIESRLDREDDYRREQREIEDANR